MRSRVINVGTCLRKTKARGFECIRSELSVYRKLGFFSACVESRTGNFARYLEYAFWGGFVMIFFYSLRVFEIGSVFVVLGQNLLILVFNI